MKFEQPPTADQNDRTKEEEQPQKDEELLNYEPGVGIKFTELLKHEKGKAQELKEEETTPEQAAAKRIESAEQKVTELYDDGRKQVEATEQRVNLSAEDITAVREEVGLFSRLGEIKEKASGLLGRLKEKFFGFLAKEKTADVIKQKAETERPEYQELKDYLKYEQKELSRPIIEEAKRKRDQLLEARGLLSMSKEDFSNYFSSKDFDVRADLKQQNVGDCYAVAAIHAMSRSPHFEMICRSSMKKLPDGSWQVRVPLLSESGQMVTITQEEISPQWNKQFLRRGKDSKFMPDLRPRLKPVKGKEGLQVLEAAFIKAKFGTVDRLAAEGGWGDEVLLQLGGDKFKQYRLNSATYNTEKKKWEYPGLNSLNEKQQAYLDHYLENFDPEVHMATVSTKHGKGETLGFYKAKEALVFLVPGHAYSISGVDREKRVVTVANPWNTAKPINLTFDQFKENFSGFEAIRIDSAKMLQSMKKVERKTA